MNEKLDLVKILKDIPKGTGLYCTAYGEVELTEVDEESNYPIIVQTPDGECYELTQEGKLVSDYGECLLFPSKVNRDWSTLKSLYHLKPFEKVLVRFPNEPWCISLFERLRLEKDYPEDDCRFSCINGYWKECLPYNEETAKLLGTKDDYNGEYKYY